MLGVFMGMEVGTLSWGNWGERVGVEERGRRGVWGGVEGGFWYSCMLSRQKARPSTRPAVSQEACFRSV